MITSINRKYSPVLYVHGVHNLLLRDILAWDIPREEMVRAGEPIEWMAKIDLPNNTVSVRIGSFIEGEFNFFEPETPILFRNEHEQNLSHDWKKWMTALPTGIIADLVNAIFPKP